MPLHRYRYTVDLLVGGQESTHEVEVRHGDLLRAELEAGRQNLPVDPRLIPQQTTTLWVWCALLRTHVIDVDYRTFRDGDATLDPPVPPVLLNVAQVRDDQGDPVADEVPPTSPDSDSPSLSLPGSATSTGGSIPTPTND